MREWLSANQRAWKGRNRAWDVVLHHLNNLALGASQHLKPQDFVLPALWSREPNADPPKMGKQADVIFADIILNTPCKEAPEASKSIVVTPRKG